MNAVDPSNSGLVHGSVASSACQVGQRAVPQHIRVGLMAYPANFQLRVFIHIAGSDFS